MRKTMVIALVLAVFGLSSCKKEDPTFCWECMDMDMIFHDNGTVTAIPFAERTLCDRTEAEIEAYEEVTWTGTNTAVVRECEKLR